MAWAAGVGVVVGVGVAGGGVGVVAGRTVVDAVKKLLAGLGSNAEAEAEALLLSGPTTVGVTTKVTEAKPEKSKSPRWQMMVLVPSQVPRLGVTETKFAPAGTLSFTVTFGAPPWPPRTPTNTFMV
jgi:hypothetical protein